MDPAWQRDMLLDEIPALVRKYGNIAATAAAEWYEQARASQVGGSYEALTAGPYQDAAVQDTVRFKAGDLFTGDAADMAAFLEGSLSRWIQYSGRETVARNVQRDSSRPRFARVPTGAKTCAFCSMLASRGFVYESKERAEKRQSDLKKYHDDCDCQVVPEWDADQSHIEGYDPDRLYARYQRARDAAGDNPTTNDILAKMRELYPDDYTDGTQPER